MSKKSIWPYAAAIALIGSLLLLLANANRDRWNVQGVPQTASLNEKSKSNTKAKRIPQAGEIEVGGVIRPLRDVVKSKRDKEGLATKPLFNVGLVPTHAKDKNVYTKSVAEAIESGDKSLAYRLTPFVKPPSFDRQEYLANPAGYLNDVAPGRIFDVLPYSENTPKIRREGKAFFSVLQGEAAVLRATTEPHMPVTFYSNNFGEFNDGLSTITVAADDEGIAQVKFKTTPGMSGEVDIVATSPVRSGKARYVVQVEVPQEIAAK